MLPAGLTTIGEGAFRNCSSLVSICIPNSLTTVNEKAFSGCQVKSIICEKDSPAVAKLQKTFPDAEVLELVMTEDWQTTMEKLYEYVNLPLDGDLSQMYNEVSSLLSPILFSDIDWAELAAGWDPSLLGSMNLDELYAGLDPSLLSNLALPNDAAFTWLPSSATASPTATGSVQLSSVKVGDRFSFGAYEQDNNSNNGKEQIVWRVLKVESDRALVISDQILDRQKYHTKSFSVTWETSSIREWLNDKFLQSAFTADERQQILTVTVPAQDHPAPQTDNLARLRGNDTRDQIFLLNAQEAEALFGSDEDRQHIRPSIQLLTELIPGQ